MGRKFSRQEILARLRSTATEGKPIIAAGSSAGIIAKCAELGGADLIMVYSSGRARLQGLQTTILDNSNKLTLDMYDEIENVVENTPIIAGIDATDPSSVMDLPGLVKKFSDTGFSGIINFPTYGFFADEEWRREREAAGIGFSREAELIRAARQSDIFTMAYVFYPEDARTMARAGVDCMVPHAGGTTGGLVGFDSIAASLQDAASRVQEMIAATREVNPNIICLAHGGPFSEPADTAFLYEKTDAAGFVGASSIERIPVERAVKGVVEEFKKIRLKRNLT
ncbi:MAG: phosphoenolpyruvate hydrolase family protein [Dehalococcoidia bacterium]|nr:phosphoenolpyruvate hydrolase family protein [Dehalococcoidia bacterium]